jgi:hypothetical protein
MSIEAKIFMDRWSWWGTVSAKIPARYVELFWNCSLLMLYLWPSAESIRVWYEKNNRIQDGFKLKVTFISNFCPNKFLKLTSIHFL